MTYKKGSPDDPEQWLAYQLSGGLVGYPPPVDWDPQPVQLDGKNENWLRGRTRHPRAAQERKYTEELRNLLRGRRRES